MARTKAAVVKQPVVPGAETLISAAPAFREALRGWYAANHRALPWRTQPSLYRTVVSEMMLQQTRVDAALPYFDRWMTALPDFASLAAASEEKVLKLWEGLGYYRRARNLHRLAQEIVVLPEIPRSAESWQRFPGIGPYSAAAITSIAFGTPAACVDGNVVRVLARLTGTSKQLKDSASATRLFQPLAQELIDRNDPGAHNQAMMELGATACQRKPNCPACPVADFCEARRLGTAAKIPAFPSREVEKIEVVRVWIERGGRVLLCRARSDAQRLANLCELPTAETIGWSPLQAQDGGELLLRKKRSITRYSITEFVYAVKAADVIASDSSLFWADRNELETLTFSGPHRRWISLLLKADTGSRADTGRKKGR